MLKVVEEESESNAHAPAAVGGSLLDEIVRDGARQMLAAALQAEVAAYIEDHAAQLDENGRRLVVRNGHHPPREVATAAGVVAVHAPRVNDKRTDVETGERKRFASAIMAAWARKSPQVAECCRCTTFTVCPRVTSRPRWGSSSALLQACRRPRSPG